MFKGVTFGYYAKNGYYASEKARQEVDRIAELGVPWSALEAGYAKYRRRMDGDKVRGQRTD